MKVTAFRYYGNGTSGCGYHLIRFRRGHRTRGEFTAIVFDGEPEYNLAVFGPGGLSEPLPPDEWANGIRRVLVCHERLFQSRFGLDRPVHGVRAFGYAAWASKRVLDLINDKGGSKP